MMDVSKEDFIKQKMFSLLQELREDSPRLWGKMNARQMVEHTSEIFLVSAGQQFFRMITPEEQLPKYKEFLYSEKIFRENTKAPVTIIGEEPAIMRTASLTEAIGQLQHSVAAFIQHFEQNPATTTTHPVFGPLTYEEWILLHYKHVTHHLRQFGLKP